ncbi:MAG: bifunctional diaminohydroxyphosphoribosylaminopyrimidine deaminase/5-amino-6-(5-phosphoribosylamino)uracil reductase RibD [Carbonactinosporaceae bacterium]
MRRAIMLAARGLGTTSPNPAVGCVVLDADGRTAGEGFHERAGAPHAEVHALRQAADRARGGTLVVTLEPCNHQGRTGPCRQAVLDAGIRRVVAAVRDPYPPAAGGVEALRGAGVEVETGVLEHEAALGNEVWLAAVQLGRPFVTWKYAATLDGRIAAADGTSRWITSPEARADAHRLRAEADAVLVGSGTLAADDPHLAVRDAEVLGGQPLRVVVDTEARIRPSARVLDDAAPTLVAVAGDADATHLTAKAAVLRLPRSPRGLDLPALLAELYRRDVRAVLVEGGPTLAGSLLQARLVDRVVGYLAPAILGAGPAALAGPGVSTIDAALRLRLDEVTRVGPDLRLVARFPVRDEPGHHEPACEPASGGER